MKLPDLNGKSDVDLHKLLAHSENHLVLIFFTASWSGSAQLAESMLRPVISSSPNIKQFKVDIEENANLAAHFGVRQIPTIVLIREREIIDYFTGVMNKKKLRARLDKSL